jgi:hypothetical protein
MSQDEIDLYSWMVLDDFLRKNPNNKINLSKHERLREALESEEVRRTLVKIGSPFVGTPGYNWKLETHLLSIVPINSEFHNAELAHIAIKSHRRSAFDLQRARGKRRPIIIIITFPRFNPLRIFRPEFSMNGLDPYSTIGSCYYANYSYSHCSISSSSSNNSVASIPAKFLLHLITGIRDISEPKGHFHHSMKDNNSYIAGAMGTTPVDKSHHKQHQQPSDSNASNKQAVNKSTPSCNSKGGDNNHKIATEKTNVKTKAVSKARIIHEDERWRNDIINRVMQLQKELGGWISRKTGGPSILRILGMTPWRWILSRSDKRCICGHFFEEHAQSRGIGCHCQSIGCTCWAYARPDERVCPHSE